MEENNNRKENDGNENKGTSFSNCIIWGMLVGIVFGAAIKNVGTGIAVGVCWGYMYWIFIGSKKKDK